MLQIPEYKKKIEATKCVVIGDVMIDEYVLGKVNRISPEAPIPIVQVSEVSIALGGAANVAKSLVRLGASCTLISAVGQDSDGDALEKNLQECGVRFSGIRSSDRRTTKKTRVIGNLHQLVRLDREDVFELSAAEEEVLLQRVEAELKSVDVVILSDYKKGICTERLCQELIRMANQRNIKVIVDPKQSDWSRYSGAFLIKPNLKEYQEAILQVTTDIEGTAKPLLEKYRLENILVTCSQDGMVLVGSQQTGRYQTEAREVFDVSGAGDTVIATIAAFLGAGAELPTAIRMANVAAGISVGKLGTYAVSMEEIVTALTPTEVNKVKRLDELMPYLTYIRANKRIVFTNGCFDILHVGHSKVLQEAKKLGDILIVGLNSDASVKRLKGEARPINSQTDRASMLAALECVDFVVIFEEDTPLHLIKAIMPEVLVKGGDYRIEDIVGADVVSEHGGVVQTIPLVEGKSTTNLIHSMEGM